MANVMVTLQKLANENTKKTFEYNAKEATTAREWQTEMSNTSHQREVKDLVAAGLNPVLSSGGSGAQSYTTSAASGVADSAVNAIGNVSSARTAAAATRYAAQQQAAAARYASQMQYAAAVESAKWNYKTNMDKPQGSPFGILDKLLGKSGTWNAISEGAKNKVAGTANSIIKKPQNYFENKNNANKSNFELNKQGRILTNRALDGLNIRNTSYNQRLYVKAFVFNDKKAQNEFAALVKIANKNKANAASNVLNNNRW